MSSVGAAQRAGVPASRARAEASRKNGAKARGPRTAEGRSRSAQNALKHGLRAEKYVVLPDEDAAEFAGLQAALFESRRPWGAAGHARAARSPLGVSPGRTASRPTCSRSGAMATPALASR